MVKACEVDASRSDLRVGEAGSLDVAAIPRRYPATDPVGQASGNGSTRRQPSGAVSIGICALLAGFPTTTYGGPIGRQYCRWPSRGDAHTSVGRNALAVSSECD